MTMSLHPDSKKDKNDILAMVDIIHQQVEALPPSNTFGESNAHEIQELNDLMNALRLAARGHPSINNDIIDWLNGEPSDLNDFLM